MQQEVRAAAYRRYKDASFFGSLNGIRFLCIIAVMWHHSPMSSMLSGEFPLLGRGFLGVDFFFVLSGFLITTLLLREEERQGRFSLANFYRRRALRIVPPYFLLITAVAGYYVVWKGQEHLAPLVPYYYLFLSNFLIDDIPLLTITWLLAVEEQYYLMWSLLLLLVTTGGCVSRSCSSSFRCAWHRPQAAWLSSALNPSGPNMPSGACLRPVTPRS